MKIVFRTDSALQIGSGHVMRCLTLADELRQRGADILFVCREHTGNLISLIESKGYPVVRLPKAEIEFIPLPEDVAHAAWLGVSWQQDAVETVNAIAGDKPDWIIIDHYAIDRRWEQMIRPHVGKIMMIDDLADRPHDCDLLLDQNLYQAMETRYVGLVPEPCHKLLGPKYALLRPEFAAARKILRQRDGQIRRVLVFFGGVDPTNETEKALLALAGIGERKFAIDVVVGVSNPNKEKIFEACLKMSSTTFHCQVNNMAELIANADLALAAGGSTMWERCFLKVPAIVCITADNQCATTEAVDHFGAIWNLGNYKQVTVKTIYESITTAIINPSVLIKMGESCGYLMDDFKDVSMLAEYITAGKSLEIGV